MCGLFSEDSLSINYDNNQCKASNPTDIVPEVEPGSDRGLQYWTTSGSLRRGKFSERLYISKENL